jgi:4-hydroxy-tetrahydrodipicolinate reductase
MSTIRVMHVGLGPVGAAVVRQVAGRAGLKSVGAVDVDPVKVGRDLGSVVGLPPSRTKVSSDLVGACKATSPDVAVLCTGSSIIEVLPQIAAILNVGVPIVSTSEELSYPSYTHAQAARSIHGWARAASVAVLGTGVNPGFAMDALPIMLTSICERVDRVTVRRIQDARVRRLPFQQKIGAGLTEGEFKRLVRQGAVRHVGFTESIAMIAAALGWTLDAVREEVRPKLASAAVSSEFVAVSPGLVCGMIQDGVGFRRNEPVIRLHMEAYLGAPESYDEIDIEGVPPVSVRVPGGLPGDIATASIVVNSIPNVLGASPGLHTMRDLPLPSFFPGFGRVRARPLGRRREIPYANPRDLSGL